VAIRYLTAGTHPDHDTICKFRRENLEAFRESFVDVLELARELKLLKLGNVSLDGAHLKANASIDQNVNYKRASFTQSYNAQAAVDGSQLVVGQHVSQSAGDFAELENGVASIPSQLGKPESVLADAGYVNADAFDRLEQEGVEVYCSVHREDAHNERHYDFRPESGRAVKEPADERLVVMRDKLRTEKGKALYAKRNHTVEPVFGIIKAAMGFRGFSLRGKEKVSGEWALVCLAYNLKRLHGMVEGAKCDAGRPKLPSMNRNPFRDSRAGDWLKKSIQATSKWFTALTARSTAKLALTPTDS
jgi:hypothetical protein